MTVLQKTRIDKWIWAVRLFKTRSLAGTACQGGRVKVNDEKAKPAYMVSVGDVVTVKKGQLTHIYEVTGIIEKRVSAKLAAENFIDKSPPPPPRPTKQNSAFIQFPIAYRERGSGRPTKKDRREIDRLKDLD